MTVPAWLWANPIGVLETLWGFNPRSEVKLKIKKPEQL